MAMSFDQMKMEHYQREQEETMRQRHWEQQQRQMMDSSAYYDMNRNAFFSAPCSQGVAKEAPKLVPPSATDPLAFMENKANKVLLTQGEI